MSNQTKVEKELLIIQTDLKNIANDIKLSNEPLSESARLMTIIASTEQAIIKAIKKVQAKGNAIPKQSNLNPARG